jgi:hypothetical protein
MMCDVCIYEYVCIDICVCMLIHIQINIILSIYKQKYFEIYEKCMSLNKRNYLYAIGKAASW